MKNIQVLLIIFCLGIFLFPKDNFYAQTSPMDCCKKETKTKSCCDKHEGHNSSKEDHKKNSKSSCNDDCCTSCVSCLHTLEIPFSKNTFANTLVFAQDKNLNFQYSDPYISDSLEDIWQPPKLG